MSNSTERLNKVLRTLDDRKLAQVAYKAFVDATPERSGNAKNKTTLSGQEIRADYPYAKRLEEGYSKQAPDGMTKPAIEAVRQHIENRLGVRIDGNN